MTQLDAFSTAAAAALVIGSITYFTVIGWTVLYTIRWSGRLVERAALAPVVGISLVLVLLTNLVYLDIPVGIGGPGVAVASLLATAAAFVTHRVGRAKAKRRLAGPRTRVWRLSRRARYVITVAVCLSLPIVLGLLVQGSAYLVIGPRDYLGAGTRDAWNYTTLTQFLMDVPYSTSSEATNHLAAFFVAQLLKNDRIGFDIIQGFLATSTRQVAATLWGAASLLGPLLSGVGIVALARRLGANPWTACLAGMAAVVQPGLAWSIVKNDAGSQSLCLPLLVMWPLVVDRCLVHGRWPDAILVALTFSALALTYPEFGTLIVLVGLAGLAWSIVARHNIPRSVRTGVLLVSSAAAGLFLVPSYAPMLANIVLIRRPLLTPIMNPADATTLDALVRVFALPDQFADLPPMYLTLPTAVFVIVGITGLLHSIVVAGSPLAVMLAAFVLLPVVILSYSPALGYQYYKLLVSVSLLLPVGGAILAMSALRRRKRRLMATSRRADWLIASAVGSLTATMCLLGAVSTTRDNAAVQDSGFLADTVRAPAAKLAFATLEGMRSNDRVLLNSEFDELAALAAYHGRGAQLWLAKDFFGPGWGGPVAQKLPFEDVASLDLSPEGGVRFISLSAFRASSPETANEVILTIDNPELGGVGGTLNAPAALMGRDLVIKVASRSAATITLHLNAKNGPAARNPEQQMQIGSDQRGWQTFDLSTQPAISYSMQTRPGLDQITMRTVGAPQTTSASASAGLVYLWGFWYELGPQ